MATEKTEAIVIRLADFSESSRVVTLFTRDWGKISAIAKGGRRLKGPFEAALDLLTACRIVFIRKASSSLDILTEAQVISRFRPKSRELGLLYSGYYVAELLATLTEEYDPHPVLFDQALETLQQLAEAGDFRIPILRFELVALREIGQLPAFDACLECGNPVQAAGTFAFWVSQGGLICSKCDTREFNQLRVQTGTVMVLNRLSGEHATSGRLAITPQQIQEIRHIVTSAISHAMGHRPKMLRYLQF